MSSSQQKLKQNIEQQTKRLLSQLQQLDTLRQELSQQEYQQLRQSTLDELQIFQQSLENMLKDPNNSVLESDLQKTKRMIYEAVKQKFNQNQIKSIILESQVKGIRDQISKLDSQYNLKKITQKQYMKKRRNLVVRLEEAGVQLTKEQCEWLKTNESFSSKEEGDQSYEGLEKNEMKIAQQSIKKDL